MSGKNKELTESFLKYLVEVQGYSQKTYISYKHDLERLCEFACSHDIDLTDFTFEDARLFSLELYNKKLAPSTINRITSSCRSFFHSLCESGIKNENPFKRVSRAKQGRKIPTVLSKEEIDLILNSPVQDYKSLMEVTMFNLFYSTGCRLSELVNMKVSDLDLKGRKIPVLGKGNKVRYVFLTQRAVNYLEQYLPERRKILNQNKIESDILLLNKKGKQLPLSSLHVIFDTYGTRLGITKKFTPHVFRHTFATHLLDNDSDIRVVQALLGHESVGTTQIYTHVTTGRLEKVYRNAHPHATENKEN